MKRTRRELARAEWDFWPLHKATSGEQRFAWVWELDRELGSGNPPYLSLPMATRQKVVQRAEAARTLRTPVEELSLPEFLDTMRGYVKRVFDPFSTLHLLRFDWEHFTRAEILEAVGRWIDSKPDYTLRTGGLAKKTGRPVSYFSKLVFLAILRSSNAGFTFKEGKELLAQAFPKSPPKGLPNPIAYRAIDWSDAKGQALMEIRKRHNELLSVSANFGGNWHDRFVQLPTN